MYLANFYFKSNKWSYPCIESGTIDKEEKLVHRFETNIFGMQDRKLRFETTCVGLHTSALYMIKDGRRPSCIGHGIGMA